MHRIGIDIGRVIIGPVVNGRADTSFLGSGHEEAMRTPPAPGAFAGVAELVARTGGNAWLVSKCGPGVQAKTRAWLAHHRFWEETGMDPSHLRFCLARPDKAVHARKLRLTVMIDDRLDVLEHLRGLVEHKLLFGEQKRPAPPWTTPVLDWAAVHEWAARQWPSAA
ncbi:hypothetical protein OV079_01780 [Nannocystis pusilla]|uniref:Uncharacterized protein n=1 Tax=Nannocystis pusilla TaxID=889268 RepID=A0A9X3EJE1_9BACT|nr:hypothetical protein [Nannocystis pusilla]MCY1004314.1 hypothetical protein [Nannocystis pusilla]